MNQGVLEALIREHEGVRTKVYSDTMGIPTIGVGFNLTRPDAPTRIKAVGANYQKIMSGEQELTLSQIAGLLSFDIHEATEAARVIVHNFDEQPDAIQHVIVDMIFNLGPRGFANFEKTIAALEAKDYAQAAQHMANSRWATQVPNRAQGNIEAVKGHAA